MDAGLVWKYWSHVVAILISDWHEVINKCLGYNKGEIKTNEIHSMQTHTCSIILRPIDIEFTNS